MSWDTLFSIPFFNITIGFNITAIGCPFYNLISKWTGGIELKFETLEEEME